MTMVFNSSVTELGDELDKLLQELQEQMNEEDTLQVQKDVEQEKKAWAMARTTAVSKALESGLLSAWITRTEIETKDIRVPNGTRANWFPMARLMGLEYPAIATVETPSEKTPEAGAEWLAAVKEFLSDSGLRAYTWTMGENISMYVAKRKVGTYLPENIDDPRELQSSISGFTFAPGAIPGKISKPLRALGMSAGTVLSTVPSTWANGQGRLNLPDGKYGIVRVHDTKGAGDGGGIIKESFARKLLRISGQPYSRSMYGIYMVAIGENYAFKAFLIIRPDQHFPTREEGPDGGYIPTYTDMLVDSESFKKVVFNSKFTIVKLTPHSNTTRKYHFVTPLIQLQLANRFVNPGEAGTRMPLLAEQVFDEHWDRAVRSDHTDKFAQVPHTSTDPDIMAQVARLNESADDAALAYEATGKSIAANPGVMRRIVGKPLNNWLRHARKASPAPATFVSGETVYAVYPFYAGVDEPTSGYVRLVFDQRTGSLQAMAFNKEDLAKATEAVDTLDYDSDRTSLVPLATAEGSEALIMRTPQSIDGGLCLRMYDEEANRLKSSGYHFYAKQGGHQWPGLYDKDLATGAEKYPATLIPPAFESPPKWTNNEEEGLQFLLETSGQKSHLGVLTNLLYSLDYAGHFTPEWKFRFSTDGVDHMLNCDADTGVIVEKVENHLYELVMKGKSFDPCTYGRIAKVLENRHKAIHGEDAEMRKPVLKCNPEDHRLKDWSDRALDRLTQLTTHAINLANGPSARLVAEVPEKTVQLAARAFTARNKNWAITLKKCDAIAEAGGANASAEIDALFEAEKQRDINTIELAQLRSSWAKDYRPGDFMTAWIQMTVSKASRFSDEGMEHEEISLHSLEKAVPEEEKRAFYARGRQKGGTPLTALVPVFHQAKNLYGGQPCKVTSKKVNGQTKWILATPKGKTILAELGPSAQNYEGYPLKVVGFTPDYSDLMKQEDCLVLKVSSGLDRE